MVCPPAFRWKLQERDLRYFDHLARPPVYMPTLCLSEVTLPKQISQALTSIFVYYKDGGGKGLGRRLLFCYICCIVCVLCLPLRLAERFW